MSKVQSPTPSAKSVAQHFGRWTLDFRHWTLNVGLWTLDVGHLSHEAHSAWFRNFRPASAACLTRLLAGGEGSESVARYRARHSASHGGRRTRLARHRCDLDKSFSSGSLRRSSTVSLFTALGTPSGRSNQTTSNNWTHWFEQPSEDDQRCE